MEFTLRGDYIQGQFTHTQGVSSHQIQHSDERIEKFSPADSTHKLWDALVKYDHIEQCIESAQVGYEVWRKTSLEERMNLLKKFQEIANKRKEEIATSIALETGKPLWESLTEAASVVAKVDVTLKDSYDRIKPQTLSQVLPNIDGHIVRKPLGPCLVIGPFNFPCHLANGQILAALLAGNSIIFKPSEKTMYSAQLLIECFHQAGFPKGVINLIHGTGKTTQDILRHESIKGIFFTGSLAVGKKILEAVGTDLTKLVALELGGKNSTIIHHDAHLEHGVTELLRACFLSSGQRCTSTSLIAIHKDIEQEFIDKFKQATQRIIIDHPIRFKHEPFMGPLIDEASVKKYRDYLTMATEHGAQTLFEQTELETEFQGQYVGASIHYLESHKATKSNPITQEEIFAPNCCFIPYEDIDEAIKLTNMSDYGLAASVFTQDKDIYQLCLRDIDSGLINLNRSTVGASARLPFGGVKSSGNYRPAAVSMIDHTVATLSSLETLDSSSRINDVKGLKS